MQLSWKSVSSKCMPAYTKCEQSSGRPVNTNTTSVLGPSFPGKTFPLLKTFRNMNEDRYAFMLPGPNGWYKKKGKKMILQI